jgi:hypothetical protein
LTSRIHTAKEKLKDKLYKFISNFSIDLLIPENSVTIPLNIPLGLPSLKSSPKPDYQPLPIIMTFSGSVSSLKPIWFGTTSIWPFRPTCRRSGML